MATEESTNIRTLQDVLDFMAPFAGGSVPDTEDSEYADWVGWIQNKQEEYARRAFWRRCLTRETFALTDGDTTGVLPDRFNKPNALFMFIVDEVDWNENPNSDSQNISIEMITDPDDSDFGKWQMRFENEITEDATAIMWYYANPPKPVDPTDILLLPGDMVGFSALQEYFRQANQTGSQDDARDEAENRFQEYLSMEVIPDKSEFISTRQNIDHDYLTRARNLYASRSRRNYQN